jgi:squalene-hopene/tetraprenyl-beta-curcumene cyclase
MNETTLSTARPSATAQDALEERIRSATRALLERQQPDGHWVFELEADATIPAEYVLLRHYRGEPVDAELERKIAAYLLRIQRPDGGWPLFQDGDFDMSASVKAYFALKTIGEPLDAEPCGARAKRSSRAAARSTRTCSPASCWRCSTSCLGARFR